MGYFGTLLTAALVERFDRRTRATFEGQTMSDIQTRNPVFGRPIVDEIVGGFSAVPLAAFLVTPKVHLFTAGPTPILPTSLPANFTEATFAGYAPQALTLPLIGPVQYDPDHRAGFQSVNFLAGAVVAPGETILGYWIDELNVAGTKLYMGEYFAVPVPITALGQFIHIDIAFAIAQVLALLP